MSREGNKRHPVKVEFYILADSDLVALMERFGFDDLSELASYVYQQGMKEIKSQRKNQH